MINKCKSNKNEIKFVCVAGKNNIAVDVMLFLLGNYSYEFGVICNRTETGRNTFQKSLRWFAKKYGIREYCLEDMYGIEKLLFLSLEFDQLVLPSRFRDARIYNIHFSALPKYKGMYTSVHPILNGENESGVTLHEIDSGIDTGDIVAQRLFSIRNLSCRDVYSEYIKHGTNLVIENIDRLIDGNYSIIKQPTEQSSYYSKKSIDFKNVKVNLRQTAYGIGRQIYAYGFREYQLPRVNGKAVIDYTITNQRSLKKPGTVLLENSLSCIVSTIDYDIILYYDRFDELLEKCKRGDISAVKSICTVKRHVNEKDTHGWSPLIVATYYNKKEIINYLISIGADIRCVNNNGTNLLMYAKEAYKKYGDSDLFKLYLEFGLSLHDKDYGGFSVLDYLKRDNIYVTAEGGLSDSPDNMDFMGTSAKIDRVKNNINLDP